MGQFKDPEGESEVLEEATEYLIQQAIRLGDDDEEEALDAPFEIRQAQTSKSAPVVANSEGHSMPEDNVALDSSASSNRRLQADEVEQYGSPGSNEELDADMGLELSEEQVARLALATARQSSTWGRIIRPPRKKGRHVILDLCTPLSALPQHRQAELSASRQAAPGTATAPGARGELTLQHHCCQSAGKVQARELVIPVS